MDGDVSGFRVREPAPCHCLLTGHGVNEFLLTSLRRGLRLHWLCLNWTCIGECFSELMLVIGRFLAVINSHLNWQLWTKAVDLRCENQLTMKEEMMGLGLAWDYSTPPRD